MSMYRSDEELEAKARAVRRSLGVENQHRIDLMTVIVKLKGALPGFDYRRVPDNELPDAEAQWDSQRRTITMRESVFAGMQRHEARARMTVAHELSHLLLDHEGIRNRSITKTPAERFARDIRREESEATRLAQRILAPAYLVVDNDTPEDIAFRFGLSMQAAIIRRDEINDLNRRAAGKGRPLPSVVVDFLKEAKRRGQTVTTQLDD